MLVSGLGREELGWLCTKSRKFMPCVPIGLTLKALANVSPGLRLATLGSNAPKDSSQL
jgi:hypothetical protein